jgi:hypothetical protein
MNFRQDELSSDIQKTKKSLDDEIYTNDIKIWRNIEDKKHIRATVKTNIADFRKNHTDGGPALTAEMSALRGKRETFQVIRYETESKIFWALQGFGYLWRNYWLEDFKQLEE